ncbi:hypothetical protein N9A86_05295, partial [Akkermansiaceae bacterium]|nr:hypothetical protein [Akkermansiaceae bacterium]
MKALLILLTLASVCYGRLGETLDECKARYGKPVKVEKTQAGLPRYFFKKNNFEIAVVIYQKKAASIEYLERSKDGKAVEMNRGTVVSLRDKNCPGVRWLNIGDKDGTEWIHKDY